MHKNVSIEDVVGDIDSTIGAIRSGARDLDSTLGGLAFDMENCGCPSLAASVREERDIWVTTRNTRQVLDSLMELGESLLVGTVSAR